MFWKWEFWPWVGDVVASQPFLTLMVPVVTLAGVLFTARSNERVRMRELQHQSERWRNETLRSLAAEQRESVISFLTGLKEAELEIESEFSEQAEEVSERGGFSQEWYDYAMLDLKSESWARFRKFAEKEMVRLELNLADDEVREQIAKIRRGFEEDLYIFRPKGLPENERVDLWSDPFLTAASPLSNNVKNALESLKHAAIKKLHPTPVELHGVV